MSSAPIPSHNLPVYKSPKKDHLLTKLYGSCQTPILKIKFCNLLNPFYYPNNHLPRYSVTCLIDPSIHGDFLDSIRALEAQENVASTLKAELDKDDGGATGKLIMKFQAKSPCPVFVKTATGGMERILLEDDLASGERVRITYDVMRYQGPDGGKHGLNFRPTSVYLLMAGEGE